MGFFSHKNASNGANQRGYSKSQKNTVNKLTRNVSRSQKVVDTKGKADSRDGKGKR